MNKLREFERPEYKDEIRFHGLKNPAYARERATLETMKKDLLLKTQTPTPSTATHARTDPRATPDLITPDFSGAFTTPTPGAANGRQPETTGGNYIQDPFGHLRNKERGGELVKIAIDQYFIDDGSAA